MSEVHMNGVAREHAAHSREAVHYMVEHKKKHTQTCPKYWRLPVCAVSVCVESAARSGSAEVCAGVRDNARILGSKDSAARAGRPSGESWGCREKMPGGRGADAPIRDRRGDCVSGQSRHADPQPER